MSIVTLISAFILLSAASNIIYSIRCHNNTTIPASVMMSQQHFLVSQVPILYQYPILPTGCESVSLTMMLQYFLHHHHHHNAVTNDKLSHDTAAYWRNLDMIQVASVIRDHFSEPLPHQQGREYHLNHQKQEDDARKMDTEETQDPCSMMESSNSPDVEMTSTSSSTAAVDATSSKGEESLQCHLQDHCIGGNPNRAFVGDPFNQDSFGMFHQVAIKALESKYLLPSNITQDPNFKIVNLSQKPLLEIFSFMVQYQMPVVIWTTLKQREPFYKDNEVWWDYRNPGKQNPPIRWLSPEHCVTLVGFDFRDEDAERHVVIVNDPDTGKQERYNKRIFEERFVSMGKQAVSMVM